jgi:hypothetical protein
VENGAEETNAHPDQKSLFRVLDLHALVHVSGFAAFQDYAAKSHLRRQIGRSEQPVAGNDEVKGVRGSGSQAGFFLSTADNPACSGLAHGLALLVEQEHHGAGGFDVLAQSISERQRHHRFLTSDLCRKHRYRQLRVGLIETGQH